MTRVYFVRHAQSLCGWKGTDKEKPLTDVGLGDSEVVTVALRNVKFDCCFCSSYQRSIDTIKGCAEAHALHINTDDRFGERKGGANSTDEDLVNRWKDFDYHEEGGESIRSCQHRNIEALNEVLTEHRNETILLGTHGTALCTIMNHFNKDFGIDYFNKIFEWLPYIVRVDFDGTEFVNYEEVLILNRGY